MNEAVDTITINASHEATLAADRADIIVTIKGSSLFTGRAALQKAAEIRELSEDLQQWGIQDDDIGLEGVWAHVSSGFLSKSSSATYRLRIRCNDLDQLPDVLGAVTSTKNATLDEVIWKYPNAATLEAQWLEACIERASVKAQAAARALRVDLVGIRRLTETAVIEADDRPLAQPFHGYPAYPMQHSMPGVQRHTAAPDAGFELGHEKRAGLVVTVEYRISAPRTE